MGYLKNLTLGLAVLPTALWAADAEVMNELSARSRFPMMEILPALDHCTLSQHTRNMCAYYKAIAAEMDLDRLVGEMGTPDADTYAQMKADVPQDCVTYAETHGADRQTYPMTVSLCIADRFNFARERLLNGGELFPLHALYARPPGGAGPLPDADGD